MSQSAENDVSRLTCRDCGADWQPVRRGECLRCGSDGTPIRRVVRPDSAHMLDCARFPTGWLCVPECVIPPANGGAA